jgi:hypothetical protein
LNKLRNIITPHHCNQWLNWDVTKEHELLKFNPPPNYPKDKIPPSNELKAQHITYKSLKKNVPEKEYYGKLHCCGAEGWNCINT